MEQRREERIESDQAAWITIYGNPDKRIPGRVRNLSGRGIGVEVGEEVGTGRALKIETGDTMLLGEVIYCQKEGERYYLGIELEQALYGLAALGKAMREFEGAQLRGEQSYAMYEAGGEDQDEAGEQDDRGVLLELPPH